MAVQSLVSGIILFDMHNTIFLIFFENFKKVYVIGASHGTLLSLLFSVSSSQGEVFSSDVVGTEEAGGVGG